MKYFQAKKNFSLLMVSSLMLVFLQSCGPKPKSDNNSLHSANAKIELGKQLYFETRISKTGTISCNSCHDVMGSGTDNQPFSTGINGLKGGRNAPTVWNAVQYSVQFWDGRAKNLAEQAKGPMINPVEMGMANHDVIVQTIAAIPQYVNSFENVYGKNALTINNIVDAIAAYEKTLITSNSPFDKFMKGDANAISASAKNGYDLIQKIGCTSCHSGNSFSGPSLPEGQGFYMKFPTMTNPELEAKYAFAKDLGRYEVTKNEADKNMWRVPSWENVAITQPYFHNGAVATLEEAVKVMAKTQLGKDLTDEETKDIVAFLSSLTGERPVQTKPVLPQ